MSQHAPSAPAAAPDTVRNVLIGIGLVALALLLWAGRNALFLLFLGLLLGSLLSVLVGRFVRWGMPRTPALLLVLVLLLGLLAGFSHLLLPAISEQLVTVGREVPQLVDRVGAWAEAQYRAITGRMGEPDPFLAQGIRERAMAEIADLVGGAWPVLNTLLGGLAGLLIVLVVGTYTAARPDLYREGLVRLVPPAWRGRVTDALDRAGDALRRWMLGTAINMVVVGVLTYVGLELLGVPASLALAAIAAVFEFVPIVGAVLWAVPAVAVALTVSPQTALSVLVLYAVVQGIQNYLVVPLVMQGTVNLPPALMLLFQVLMATVFGFLGLFLAVPLLAVLLVAVRTLYVEPMEARGMEVVAAGSPRAPTAG